MKHRKRILLAVLVSAMLLPSVTLLVTWLLIRPSDPVFQGKPESYWISYLAYRDEEQVRQWREFGPDGARVLMRALDGAKRPMDRFYRAAYRKMGAFLPGGVTRLLPAPRMDATRSQRMRVVDLLASLSKDAWIAAPVMARALNDEDYSVRQIAITYFTRGEDQNTILNQMEPGEKSKLLPDFLRAMRDKEAGVRNNAAIALRYYPEKAQVVVPALVQALHDRVPRIRQLVAQSLHQIATSKAVEAGVVPVVIGVLKDPDDQLACRAAELLGEMRQAPLLTVPALIEAARSTNALVASSALRALGNFPAQAETIVPALLQALDRSGGAIRASALESLKKLAPAKASQAGATEIK